MLRRPMILGVAVSLAVVLLVGLMVAGDKPHHAGPAEVVSSAAPASCADVLLVGSNGNGETAVAPDGFGRTVQAVAGRYAAALGATRTIATHVVGGRTPGLAVLLRGAHRDKVSRLAIRASSVRRWMQQVPTVVQRAVPTLEAALARCPAQQLVLVGYAQGASVAHRIVRALASDGLLARVTGVALVSDPDRNASSAAHRDGDPAASRAHRGIARLLVSRVGDVPAPQGSYAPWELCTRGDLVCDPSNLSLRGAVAVASSYVAHGRPDPVLVRASATLVTTSGAWPVPRQRLVRAAAVAGRPVSVQLTSDASGAAAGGVQWGARAPLPSGFSLSASGLLTGTAPAGGVLNIPVAVAGTAPSTPAAAATVVITITGRTTLLSSAAQTSCETRSDATAWCWGRNDLGQFGSGATGGSSSPVQVKGTGWTQVRTSGSTTCGIRAGSLYCWGLNNYGQTGRPASKAVLSPQRVGTASDWRQVAVSWTHACGVRATGQLYCWGQNLRGQLGLGTVGAAHATPALVGGGTSWVSVVAAGWHTCATRRDGSAWCWGDNTFGALGDGTTQRRTRPAEVAGGVDWLSLSASWNSTCGVAVTGGMYCWGRNWSGELGNGTRTGSSVPARIGATRLWLTVAAGEGSACALDIDGNPWCWGANRYGQSAGSPGALVPTALTTHGNQSQIGGNWFSYCSVQVAVSCWGDPALGQLGPTSARSSARTAPRTVPRPTTPPPSAREVRRLQAMTPAQVARHDLGDRPAVTPRTLARSAGTSFRVMTYNVLGSNHTAPLADAQQYAPARLRAEWESQIIARDRPSLLGTQEPQPDQIGDFSELLSPIYAILPGTSQGYAATPQSLMFQAPAWTKVWSTSISITFVGQTRPQPIVRLRNKTTGAEVYFINVHLSPHDRQAERDRAMNILVKEIQVLAKDHLPIVLTGDFNQKKWAFCQVTGRTTLTAANGGYHRGTTCVPPAHMRVDWIFATGGTWSAFRMQRGAAVALTTDHTIQHATYTTAAAAG